MLRSQTFRTLRPTFCQIFTKFRRFGRIYCSHLQRGWRRHQVPPQLWELCTLPKYATSEKKEVYVNIFVISISKLSFAENRVFAFYLFKITYYLQHSFTLCPKFYGQAVEGLWYGCPQWNATRLDWIASSNRAV